MVERVWPPLVFALAVLILFLAASWAGVWQFSPRDLPHRRRRPVRARRWSSPVAAHAVASPGGARRPGPARPRRQGKPPSRLLARRQSRQRPRRPWHAGALGGPSGAPRARNRGDPRRPALAAHGRPGPVRAPFRRGDARLRGGGRSGARDVRPPRLRLRLAQRRGSSRRGREPHRRLDRPPALRRPAAGGHRLQERRSADADRAGRFGPGGARRSERRRNARRWRDRSVGTEKRNARERRAGPERRTVSQRSDREAVDDPWARQGDDLARRPTRGGRRPRGHARRQSDDRLDRGASRQPQRLADACLPDPGSVWSRQRPGGVRASARRPRPAAAHAGAAAAGGLAAAADRQRRRRRAYDRRSLRAPLGGREGDDDGSAPSAFRARPARARRSK